MYQPLKVRVIQNNFRKGEHAIAEEVLALESENLEFKSLLPPGQVVSDLLKPKFSQYQMEIVLFHLQDLDKDRR